MKKTKSRKAFTLVELLVAISVATVLIAAVAATLIFVIRTTKRADEAAEMTFKVRTVREYILSEDVVDSITIGDEFIYSEEDSTLYDVTRDNKAVVSDALYMNVMFSKDEDEMFLICEINYKPYSKSDEMEQITFVVKQIG